MLHFSKRNHSLCFGLALFLSTMSTTMLRSSETCTSTLEATAELKGHNAYIESLDYSPDGKNLVSGSVDKTAIIWDTQTGKKVHTLEHEGPVNAVAYSPDGKKIVTGADDKTAKIWDAQTGNLLQTLAHDFPVSAVAFSPNGEKIVTGTGLTKIMEANFIIWDASTGKEINKIEVPAARLQKTMAVAFFPDNEKIISVDSRSFGSRIFGMSQIYNSKSGEKLGEKAVGSQKINTYEKFKAFPTKGQHALSKDRSKFILTSGGDYPTGLYVEETTGKTCYLTSGSRCKPIYKGDGQYGIFTNQDDILTYDVDRDNLYNVKKTPAAKVRLIDGNSINNEDIKVKLFACLKNKSQESISLLRKQRISFSLTDYPWALAINSEGTEFAVPDKDNIIYLFDISKAKPVAEKQEEQAKPAETEEQAKPAETEVQAKPAETEEQTKPAETEVQAKPAETGPSKDSSAPRRKRYQRKRYQRQR